MKFIQKLVVSLWLLSLTACGTYNQSIQVNDRAYLLLIGDPFNKIVTIDNQNPIELELDTVSFNLNGQKATKIEIPIGKHTVKITYNGVEIVNRIFYVTNGNSFEVKL